MKKKKNLFAIIAVLLILVVGATIAYFQSSASFENVFNTGTYKLVTTEVFESPDNWKPGEEIPKTITTKNEGTIDAAVRVSYTEKWEDSEGNDITSQIDNGTAIINLDNQSKWTKEGNYYYYNYILKPNDITSSFMKSVTLNPNLGNDLTCTTSQDGLTKTCESSNPALGAKYTLTITKETVQADKYKDVWNTNVEIGEKPPLVQIMNSERDKDNLQVGDEICINGDTTECFNFIGYDGNDVKLLSKYNLKVGNHYDSSWNPTGRYSSSDTGYGLQSSDTKGYVNGASSYNGCVAFSATNYWYDGSNLKSKYGSSYPADVYDTDYKTAPDFTADGFNTEGYSIAYYVEEYKNKLTEYGATIKDARLLTYAEATDSTIGCSQSSRSCPTTGFITNTTFWLGSAYGDNRLWNVGSDGVFGNHEFYNGYSIGVRPVVVISKSDI